MSTVVVVGEVDGNEIKNISQQVAAVASGMGDVVGIVIGKKVSEAAMKLATSKIIIAEDDSLEHYDPVKFPSIVSQIVEQVNAGKV